MISVQISTFNRCNILKEVLLSLNNQTIDKDLYEVIVINDGSNDDTYEIVNNLINKVNYNLILINQEHKGLPFARNNGVLNTKRKYILFIDDDVLADKNLIANHLKTYEKYGDNIVVRGWVNHIKELKIPDKPVFTLSDISTSFFWTSNVSVKREHLIKAGLFCEKFYKYGWEDIEMGYKLRKLGLKLIINNKAIGYHYKPNNINISNIDNILKIEEYKAISAKIYYSMYKSLRVKLAVGLHAKNFYKFLYDIGLYNYLYNFLTKTDDNQSFLKNFLSKISLSLLKKMHYYKIL
ncbi:MAG: glycosyltransferase [bacterium]|nr:glycosyltransferase [bacterium]